MLFKDNDLSVVNFLKLFNIIIKIRNRKNIDYIKFFIKEYYCLNEDMSDEFYELLLNRICSDNYMSLFKIFIDRNIYLLISYLKYNQEDVIGIKEILTPLQYYNISRKHINKLIELLRNMQDSDNKSDKNILDIRLKDEAIWLLKRNPLYNEREYRDIAYKIVLSIGFDNGVELLTFKYGDIDYEKIYFLFSKLNVCKDTKEIDRNVFNEFIFGNKNDMGNVIRLMLSGRFMELFLNFDYFYNNISYFMDKLGLKMNKIKVKKLLDDRYLTYNVGTPEITGDILDDMESSYYNKYEFLDTSKEEIYQKNYQIYDESLRNKYRSSIPMIELDNKDGYICDVISLSDPRNLVLGYRTGNCFRINGEAATLFDNFLQSEHMRLISISTLEKKDFAMMLVWRNGNVLIGQGIEVSKWVSSSIKGKKLYDVCRYVLKEMMDYMNLMGDEIVVTIIGRTNENVDRYNNQILPFLINPILNDGNNYYNGIDNYQCLLDISEGKSLQDIKLYVPFIRYLDKRDCVLRRGINIDNNGDNYMDIEKRLISLRYLRMKGNINFEFYQQLLSHREVYTCCNKDWYITLFDDGNIDGFIYGDDVRAKEEYDMELKMIKQNMIRDSKKDTYCLRYKCRK